MSLTIDDVARALAEWTVQRHAEQDPTLADRYGDRWRRRWVGEVEQRIRNLAQAVAVRRPEVFAATAAWTRAAFSARDMGPEDLAMSLACLREVAAAELPDTAGVVVSEHVDAAVRRLGNGVAGSGPRTLDRLALQYLEAVLTHRRDDAIRLLTEAAGSGRSVASLYEEVLYPAQAEVGRMWHASEIGVAEEHYATATTEAAMSLLRATLSKPTPRGRRVMAASVAGDLHTIGVRMVGDFFEMDGWDVVYLGANTPTEEILRVASEAEIHLLAISATTTLALRTMGDLIERLHSVAGLFDVKVIVGGGPFNEFPGLWEELGADGSAQTAAGAVAVGNTLAGVS